MEGHPGIWTHTERSSVLHIRIHTTSTMGDDGRQPPQDTYEDLHEEEVFAEEMAPAQPESIRLDRRDLRSTLDAIRSENQFPSTPSAPTFKREGYARQHDFNLSIVRKLVPLQDCQEVGAVISSVIQDLTVRNETLKIADGHPGVFQFLDNKNKSESLRVTDPRLSEFLESVKPKEESTSRKRKAVPPPFESGKQLGHLLPALSSTKPKAPRLSQATTVASRPTMDTNRISKEVARAERSTPRRIARITDSNENWTEERSSVGPVDKKVIGGEIAQKENREVLSSRQLSQPASLSAHSPSICRDSSSCSHAVDVVRADLTNAGFFFAEGKCSRTLTQMSGCFPCPNTAGVDAFEQLSAWTEGLLCTTFLRGSSPDSRGESTRLGDCRLKAERRTAPEVKHRPKIDQKSMRTLVLEGLSSTDAKGWRGFSRSQFGLPASHSDASR
ncbi:unnamed protein product [Cylicocyclus nassatus]|uniref:Uncharacterized protein n=1 Tax=Cylicocyclus nassatus TaxID=53992 RepID=A0AA36GT32_CYLNA|nr:unnamed protein product [Cylicocyclus nassatus]